VPKIFIDANKYLEFYQSARISELIELLIALKDELVVTEQIVHEVHRNRVNVTLRFLNQSWVEKAYRYSVPEYLLSVDEAERKDLAMSLDDVNAKCNAAYRRISELRVKTLKAITDGSDEVTSLLATIFADAASASDEELTRARIRKERGDPPGKRADPLGDQLSWEQFLSRIKGEKVLWLITGDSDYRYKLPDKSLTLNPVLAGDIKMATLVETEIRCFETLTEGLSDASRELARAPKKSIEPEELRKIKEAELAQAAMSKVPVIICPSCGGASSLQIVRSAQGYINQILFFTCPHCGAKFDSGGE